MKQIFRSQLQRILQNIILTIRCYLFSYYISSYWKYFSNFSLNFSLIIFFCHTDCRNFIKFLVRVLTAKVAIFCTRYFICTQSVRIINQKYIMLQWVKHSSGKLICCVLQDFACANLNKKVICCVKAHAVHTCGLT